MGDSSKNSSAGNLNHGSRNTVRRTRSGSDKESYDQELRSGRSSSAKGFCTSFPTTKPQIKQAFVSTTTPPSRPAPLHQRPINFLFEAPQATIDAMGAKSKKIVESYNVFSGPRLGHQTPDTAFMGAENSGEKKKSSVSSLRNPITSMGPTSTPQFAIPSAGYQLQPSPKVNRLIFNSPTIVLRSHATPGVGSELQRSNIVDSRSSPFAEGGGEWDFSPKQNHMESGSPLNGKKRRRRVMEGKFSDL